MLAQALFAVSEHRIALMPQGEAPLERIGHVQVSLPGTFPALQRQTWGWKRTVRGLQSQMDR